MSKEIGIMKNKNIRKCFSCLLAFVLITGLMSSCSDNDGTEENNGSTNDKEKVLLSIGGIDFDRETNSKYRSVGSDNDPSESSIYSFEVLVFKSSTGALDGYTHRDREVFSSSSASYDKYYYSRPDTIMNIECTAGGGNRDIFVVANAPDGTFSSITNKADFLAKLESLNTQGRGTTSDPKAHPAGTIFKPISGEAGISGQVPSDLLTNLTMVGCVLGVNLDTSEKYQHIGFYTNNGYPTGFTTGKVLVSPTYQFKLYRLAARVAVKKITLDLPASLALVNGHSISNYEAYIDTVFMVNAKNSSYFSDSLVTSVVPNAFSDGNTRGYNYLKNKSLSFLSPASTYNQYLYESTGRIKDYDISKNQSMLWFYTFENYNKQAPTQLVANPTTIVIGVRFDFIIAGLSRTIKCYYPIKVNHTLKSTADHVGIKRNHQYGLNVKIKGLNNGYYAYDDSEAETIRNVVSDDSSIIEVEEEVGTNLFPWAGNTYIDYTK